MINNAGIDRRAAAKGDLPKMKKKFSEAEKLQIVLHHHVLSVGDSPFRNVSELKQHYQVSGENLRQWRRTLMESAESIFADKRHYREKESYEAEIRRLKLQIDQLEKETSWDAED